MQQAAVGHLTGEGVPEGIDLLGEELRLVEELPALEVRQGLLQTVFQQPRQPLQQ